MNLIIFVNEKFSWREVSEEGVYEGSDFVDFRDEDLYAFLEVAPGRVVPTLSGLRRMKVDIFEILVG
jgi:hypothetical protein